MIVTSGSLNTRRIYIGQQIYKYTDIHKIFWRKISMVDGIIFDMDGVLVEDSQMRAGSGQQKNKA